MNCWHRLEVVMIKLSTRAQTFRPLKERYFVVLYINSNGVFNMFSDSANYKSLLFVWDRTKMPSKIVTNTFRK